MITLVTERFIRNSQNYYIWLKYTFKQNFFKCKIKILYARLAGYKSAIQRTIHLTAVLDLMERQKFKKNAIFVLFWKEVSHKIRVLCSSVKVSLYLLCYY